jgi:hypothetical protein
VLGDVVRRAIRETPDLELVALPPHIANQEARLPDVVILAGTDPDAITWPAPELACGSTRLLAISDDSHTGCLFELLPRRRALGELTPEALIAAVRAPMPRFVADRSPSETAAEPLMGRPNRGEED